MDTDHVHKTTEGTLSADEIKGNGCGYSEFAEEIRPVNSGMAEFCDLVSVRVHSCLGPMNSAKRRLVLGDRQCASLSALPIAVVYAAARTCGVDGDWPIQLAAAVELVVTGYECLIRALMSKRASASTFPIWLACGDIILARAVTLMVSFEHAVRPRLLEGTGQMFAVALLRAKDSSLARVEIADLDCSRVCSEAARCTAIRANADPEVSNGLASWAFRLAKAYVRINRSQTRRRHQPDIVSSNNVHENQKPEAKDKQSREDFGLRAVWDAERSLLPLLNDVGKQALRDLTEVLRRRVVRVNGIQKTSAIQKSRDAIQPTESEIIYEG